MFLWNPLLTMGCEKAPGLKLPYRIAIMYVLANGIIIYISVIHCPESVRKIQSYN